MPTRKGYEPHCPAVDCSGGHADRLHLTTSEAVHMPPDVAARRKNSESIYVCSYCGLVWFQKATARPGFEARPAGWWDSIQWPWEFHPAGETYRIREQNTRDYWEEKREKRHRRRGR